MLKSKKNVEFFHFTDFMARRPPYDWDDIERDNFVERLATIVADTTTLGISFGIIKADYQELVPTLRREFRDIYYCCCYCCLESLAKWERNFTRPTLPRPLEFLFDRKPTFEGYMTRIYYEVIKDVAGNDLFGNMDFGNKEKDVPLQIADLVVGASIRYFRRQKKYGLRVERDRLIKRLNARGCMVTFWLDKDILLKYNSFARARNEQ